MLKALWQQRVQSVIKIFITPFTHSLKTRLVISALLTIIVILPLIGVTLQNAFEEQLKNSLKNELSAYSYSILAVAEVEQQQLYMPEQALDNQFNVSQTGLYAFITTHKILSKYKPQSKNKSIQQTSTVLWRSKSLLGLADPNYFPQPKLGHSSYQEIMLSGKKHFIYSFSVSFGEQPSAFPVSVHIIKDKTPFNVVINDFKQQLWLGLLALMVLLMLIQTAWLLWTLKPLRQLKKELANITQGEASQLKEVYPQELTPVVEQVNTLLTTEQQQRQRYRNALSDLAHSLKTPLAVMQSQVELSSNSIEQLQRINQIIEHQLKRAQSAGESAWHQGIHIQPIATKLLNSLAKIYQDKHINIASKISDKALFKGDEADLLEMLGNILDNACKAANQQVLLTVIDKPHALDIMIEDDGKGIPETQRKAILQRGMRADTYEKGHGIGLAIVRDLVNSYQGQLIISDSSQLNGALFILRFQYKN